MKKYVRPDNKKVIQDVRKYWKRQKKFNSKYPSSIPEIAQRHNITRQAIYLTLKREYGENWREFLDEIS